MRARGLVAAAILASSLGASCGDNHFPVGVLAQQVVEAHCKQATRCGEFTSVDTCVFGFDQHATALPDIAQLMLDPALIPAIGSGDVVYDESAAADCIAALAAESCDVSSRDQRVEPDACVAMLTGQLASGASCNFDQECASALCTPPATCASDYVCCPGTCGAPPHEIALGSACQVDGDCAGDAFCSGSGCSALLGSGSSCSTSTECDYELICIRPTPTSSGECAPPPTLGEACPGHLCADVGTTCGSAGTCVALGLPSQPCADDEDCGPEQVCDPTSLTCSEPPKLGDPCSSICQPGAWCNNPDGSDGQCDALLANGMQCESPEECASNYCADGDFATTCVDRPVCY